MNRLFIEISWASLWRVFIMGGLVLLLIMAREAVATLLLAIFISTALDGIVHKMETWRIPRLLGTVIVFVTGLSIFIALLSYAVPIAVVEFRGLFNSFGELAAEMFSFDADLQSGISEFVTRNLDKWTNLLRSNDESLIEMIQKIMGGATFVVAVIVLSFYLTASRDGVAKFLRAIFPVELEDKVLNIYYRSKRKIEYWVKAQLILGVIVGIMVFVGLSIGGVRYRLLLALISAVLEVVPIIGPIVAGAFGVVVALTQSTGLAFYVLLLFLGVQQIENNILVPILMRKAIDVHPVVILVALLGGYEVGGITGMLLAVPAAVVSQELIDDWIDMKSKNREGKTEEGK